MVVIVQVAAVVVVKSWPELVNNKLEARVSKYKFGPGPLNTNLEPGQVNTYLGPGLLNTNWGPGPGAGDQAKGRGPGNTNTLCGSITEVRVRWFSEYERDEKDQKKTGSIIFKKVFQKSYEV